MYFNNQQRIIQSPASAGASPTATAIQPQVFNFTEQQVRVLGTPDAPWFVVKDVCDILGLGNPTKALYPLDSDEKSHSEIMDIDSNGVTQRRKVAVISESGFYYLTIRSNKPQAKTFRRWVTNEVLPAIRKQGHYGTPIPDPAYPSVEQCTLESLVRRPYLPDPNLVAREMIDNHILKMIIEIADIAAPRIETREVKHLYRTCCIAAHCDFRKHPMWPKSSGAFTRIMNRLQPDFMRHHIGYCRINDEISIWKQSPYEIAALAEALSLFKPLPSKRESAMHLALHEAQNREKE